jgi:RNA polymerase sigma-70 factor (ECF subfamily)
MVARSLSRDRSSAFGGEAAAGLDEELLGRMAAGDGGAFAILLDQYWRPLVLYCARIVGSRASGEDIAQEAFVRLWEHREKWKPRSSPRALLYTIARNQALNQRKSAVVRLRILVQRTEMPPPQVATPAERIEAKEFRAALERAIMHLPARQQEVVTLSRFDGLTRDEIAVVTGLSAQTVANYLVAALAGLRTALAPYLDGS